jgi:hypothetical protein
MRLSMPLQQGVQLWQGQAAGRQGSIDANLPGALRIVAASTRDTIRIS